MCQSLFLFVEFSYFRHFPNSNNNSPTNIVYQSYKKVTEPDKTEP